MIVHDGSQPWVHGDVFLYPRESTLGAGGKTRRHTPKAVAYHEQSQIMNQQLKSTIEIMMIIFPGREAMQIAGVTKILSKHLAIASQTLGAILSLLVRHYY